jgi:ABC-type transport system substrate-binding protein
MLDAAERLIGTVLGARYEVLEEIGRGGMGVVYLGRDSLLEREVALKVIASSRVDAAARHRFLREARVIAKMDHPSIVQLYDLGSHEGGLFLVMPFVAGTSLRQLLRSGELSLGDALAIGEQVAGALDHGHARGIVHRDVKPENVLCERSEAGVRARLGDFGLAIAAWEQRVTQTGALLGTVQYFSPEQVAGRDVDARTDIYALGTLLYECLAGQPPFGGEVQAILYRVAHEPPRALGEIVHPIDPELAAVVMACLAKDPARRPQRARDVAEALERCRAGLAEAPLLATVQVAHTQRTPQPAWPLVGRERELGELCRRLDEALAGRCQLCVVGGAPGMGKTRLVEELERVAAVRGARVLHASFAEQGQASPYQGFCEIIEQYCRSAPSSGSRPVDLSDLGPELRALFPALREVPLLGTSGSVSPSAAPSGAGREEAPPSERDKSHLFEVLARALARIAGAGPLVVVCEQLHAAGVSIDALQYVVRRLAALPVLFVGTYLATEVDRGHPLGRLFDGFRGSRRFALVELGRLGAVDHQALVESLLPGASLPEPLLERLHALTEGNPEFTVVLVRSLLDDAVIVRAEGGWRLKEPDALGFESLPETIQKAVEARLFRLDEPLRELLATAAVLGTSFDFRDLEALVEDERALDDALDALVRGGFLAEKREKRGERFEFQSAMLQSVLYASLPRRKRRRLHRRAAETLAARQKGRLEPVRAQLVHHYAEADDAEKVCELGIALCRTALAAFAADEAAGAARRVLAFVDGDEQPALEAEARSMLARALRMKSELDAALNELDAAARGLARAGDAAAALGVMIEGADTAWEGRRIGDTKRWLDRAMPEARRMGDGRLRQLLLLGATVANLRGDGEAARSYLAEADELGAARPEAANLPVGGTLRVACARSLRTTDPAEVTTEAEIEAAACVFETLVTTDEAGYLLPRLCERWEALEGGRRFAFHLRAEARRHDGRPLVAADVKESLARTARARAGRLPPALAALAGGIDGVQAAGERELRFELATALPIYPALLTDPATAVALAAPSGVLVGTGPFVVAEHEGPLLRLRRSPSPWGGSAPRLDAIEIVHERDPHAIAADFRAGRVDVARDLTPGDLDALEHDASAGGRLCEAPRKLVWFALFRSAGALGADAGVRRAVFGAVPVEALVWGHLGALAQPAAGLVPPGVLGHDPGRTPARLGLDEARERLRAAGAAGATLRVAMSPTFRHRYHAFVDALLQRWRDLGLGVGLVEDDPDAYAGRWTEPGDVDVVVGGWVADYADPDTFTHGLFHSTAGRLRAWYASPELDKMLEEARREVSPQRRIALYRAAELHLLEAGVVLPLFGGHELALVAPRVRALAGRSNPPFFSYAEAAIAPVAPAASRARGGLLHVAVPEAIATIDPPAIGTRTEWDLSRCIFETLTREGEGARVTPWLAEQVETVDGARRWRIRLRDGVRFHDGRRLGARDVRWSWERVLRTRNERFPDALGRIAGAEAMRTGTGELAGLHLRSARDLEVELIEPVPFFPAMLADASTSVLPEGLAPGEWIGTGPFRVRHYQPGARLELEPHARYWRPGRPRLDGLSFLLGMPAPRAAHALRTGQCGLCLDLPRADGKELLETPGVARLFEMPVLCTYLLLFNVNKSPMSDERLRQRVAQSLPVERLVREEIGDGGHAARTFLPPGLLGSDPVGIYRPPLPTDTMAARIEIVCGVSPGGARTYPAFTAAVVRELERLGFAVRTVDWLERPWVELDMLLIGWIADFLDPDAMIGRSIHSEGGAYGRVCGLPELDELCTRARLETDPALRRSIYLQIEQAIVDRAPLMPLFHPDRQWIAAPSVQGLDRETAGLTRGIDFAELWVDG